MIKDKITGLPMGTAMPPLNFPWFPAKFQAVIWRNWGIVPPGKLASVLKTDEENILKTGKNLGLPSLNYQAPYEFWLKRGYITIIRNNWHLLPYQQLLDILDWTPEQMGYALKEDDFLWSKMGKIKPDAQPVYYRSLTNDEKKKTQGLKTVMEKHFAHSFKVKKEAPFEFFRDLEKRKALKNTDIPSCNSNFKSRFAYSYAAVYGDPLWDKSLDPFPEGLLSRYAESGINAIWLQGILYTLTPWLGNYTFSHGHETRIENLNKLTEKAFRYGIGVYLYLNEPRAMPVKFFDDHPDWKGTSYTYGENIACLCTSHDFILNALENGVTDLFQKVPGLAGAFTITMSENMTNCYSKKVNVAMCERCAKRKPQEVVAEINNTIASGIHKTNPKSKLIAWNWGWNPAWAGEAVDLLNPDVILMCTSETDVPTEAMGIKGVVSDYSISKVGPGLFAENLWSRAQKHGLETFAKVQLNNTWECSAVPYIPTPYLVKRHLRNIAKKNVSGLMVSWTLGGYPGGNFELTDKTPEELAEKKFGKEATPEICRAWKMFSKAFEEFPLNGTAQLYTAPQNYGPKNLFHAKPSGYNATMVGFPYDDLKHWRGGHYPEEVFENQFKKLCNKWQAGLNILPQVETRIAQVYRSAFEELSNIATAVYCHFKSVYHQIRFIRLRNSGIKHNSVLEITKILDHEIELTKQLLEIVNNDSRIGFEASNHYYYTENDLKEKILNCEYLKSVINI